MTNIWCLPEASEALDQTALIDSGTGDKWSYKILHARAVAWYDALLDEKGLLFLLCRNRPEDVACMLGAISAGHTVALLDSNLPESALEALQALYQPEWTVWFTDDGPPIRQRLAKKGKPIFPSTALLLSTSGSTGSAKMVRLTADNLSTNAHAIAKVLDIQSHETGMGHLPLHYSYGLSVLTSHLIMGAPLLLTTRGMMDAQFWRDLSEIEIRHLPGVPYHYQMMLRLGLDRLPLGKLRVLTQAGGALPLQHKQTLWNLMEAQGGHFHVMYGQTEASPRITTLSHADFAKAPTTVGTVLPGGNIRILDENGNPLPAGETGFVEYSGPNVMLGYAEGRDDLALSDQLSGVLATGDIGRLDEAGRLTITGRAKRIAKYVGLRINADELEATLSSIGEMVVASKDDRLIIFYATTPENNDEMVFEIKEMLRREANLPITGIKFERLDRLPRTGREKVDYRALERLL